MMLFCLWIFKLTMPNMLCRLAVRVLRERWSTQVLLRARMFEPEMLKRIFGFYLIFVAVLMYRSVLKG